MNLKEPFEFICDLQMNNNRDWFQKNKERYLKVKSEYELFAEKLIVLTREIDPAIGFLSAKDCTYRIYQDQRFSRFADPYKTHMGVYILQAGKKSGNPGYYAHLEPDASFLHGGIHIPTPEMLKAIRTEVLENAEELKSIFADKSFIKYFPSMSGEKLKNVPKDFPKDFKDAERLKYKSYTISYKIEDDFWFDDNVEDNIITVYKQIAKFNAFLYKALGNMG